MSDFKPLNSSRGLSKKDFDDILYSYSYEAEGRAIARVAAEISIDSTADKVCRRLFKVISEYEEQLDPESEIGLRLVSFGAVQTISIESIGTIGPNLIQFDGYTDGEKVSLVQHVTQLNFLLCKV